MSRYARMFERLGGRGAFVPFCVLGDPHPDASGAILDALVRGGADALELGMPFSDPVADGPTIQAADVRALNAGTTPAKAFDAIAAFRARDDTTPIGLLVYANLLEARGRDAFYARAKAAGVDSVLVADVPTVEAAPFAEAAARAGIEPVLIATSNSKGDDLRTIAALSRGYVYVVTRRGVTGAETEASFDGGALTARLAALGAAPPLMGFGISTPAHVHAARAAGAAGAISGSAVVRILEGYEADPQGTTTALETFVRTMKAAGSL
jgi:tryptophan synthase alpha chain